MNQDNNLETIRHSASHLLAAAIQELFPDTKFGVGPAIENGFYYDFDLPKPISEADLPKIEQKMGELKNKQSKISRSEEAINQALDLAKGQPYKRELIQDLKKEGAVKISFYTLGDFKDLCKGPHVENTSDIGAFKLLSVAGAYWKGSEKNKMLTRIYGTAFQTQKELDDYLHMLEESKKRDHRKLGKELGLFVFSDLVGKGLPLLTAKGTTIRRQLERFIVDEEIKRGYQHVITPPLAKVDLYRTSGHYPYYKDTMYPSMVVDEEELILRPMTCPHHFMLFESEIRSYKDLPLRIAEISPQFRYEKSGELTGLMRVRMFTLSDAHIFAMPSQAKEVIRQVLDLIDYVNNILGLKKGEDYRYRLSLGDRSDEKKYYKDNKAWDMAEGILREVLQKSSAPFYEAFNEAAFYGPKIDVQMKNVLGKEETAFTVQYDFVMPKRFNLRYIDQNGKEAEPIVIHRSSIGAFERIMAFLIERYAGAFPVWLAPTQVMIVPITDRHNDYAQKVLEQLKSANIRAEVDSRSEKMQAKIREAQLQKIPYMLIVGDKEVESGQVAVRTREGNDLGAVSVEDFQQQILGKIQNKSLDLRLP